MTDPDFAPSRALLETAVAALREGVTGDGLDLAALAAAPLPEHGMGAEATLAALAPAVLNGSADLGAPTALAHMDPPTPAIAWAVALWNASRNQNLLHESLSPVATAAEQAVIAWLAPFFGMAGGHMTGGSTLSNLTALWAAREVAGVRRVVASAGAHVSIAKSARILGLGFVAVPVRADETIDAAASPDDLSDAALVLTAGTTAAGAVDALTLAGRAAWTHVDAAWAGPLRLIPAYADRLEGIGAADSVAVSAHKWLFQPKDSALVLFADADAAHAALTVGGSYLKTPNVGVAGSRGAAGLPLLATLLAWGRRGLAARIEAGMAAMDGLADVIARRGDCRLFGPNRTGVLLWRPVRRSIGPVAAALGERAASSATVRGERWIRHVAANPNVNVAAVSALIDAAMSA